MNSLSSTDVRDRGRGGQDRGAGAHRAERGSSGDPDEAGLGIQSGQAEVTGLI